jgi:hypothetical protein
LLVLLKSTLKNILLLFRFVCAGTKKQGPMAGSQEAQAEQNDSGGLLGKIKKTLLRGLESLQYVHKIN